MLIICRRVEGLLEFIFQLTDFYALSSLIRGKELIIFCFQNQGAVNKNGKSAVENLLGEHSNLVNLDSLIQPKRGQANQPQAGAKNPFAEQPNPFQAAAAPKPSMNELRGGNQVKMVDSCLSFCQLCFFGVSVCNCINISAAASGPARRLAKSAEQFRH